MQPKHPIIWLAGVSVILFLLNYFVIEPNSTLISSIMFAVVSGIFALGLLYGGEKIRRKWFVNKESAETKQN